MPGSLDSLQRIIALLGTGGSILVGLAIAALCLGIVRFAILWWPKRKAPPPKHVLKPEAINPQWSEERFQHGMKVLFTEVEEAIQKGDVETLGVITEGPALASFKRAVQTRPQGNTESFVSAVVQSWDEKQQRLVALFLVAKHVGRWRQFREMWTVEKRGNGWFVLDRQPVSALEGGRKGGMTAASAKKG